MTALVVAFVVATAVSAVWLRIACRLTGARVIPVTDLALIAALCSGVGLFPAAGLVLALIFGSLLLLRVEHVDPWPDAIVMLAGCGLVWVFLGAWAMFR
jgi:hypothetical protein